MWSGEWGDPVTDARTDVEMRVDQRLTGTAEAAGSTGLPAPAGLTATGAVGHIRLAWTPVDGAAGYVIERTRAGGTAEPAAPLSTPLLGTVFADTGLHDAADYTYRVGAIAGAEHPVRHWSEPATARTEPAGELEPIVDVTVRANTVTGRLRRVWEMAGAERLSQLLLTGEQKWIADEVATALRRAHDDLGVRRVRAPAILHDDNEVVTVGPDGRLRYDFDRIDSIYDRILDIGIRPVVELSFMPAALARDPQQTVFTYHGIVSPPSDWARWRDLIAALATHLIDRYGIDEVATWAFEVWNEPNLAEFWTGTPEEYLRLYDETAAALKSVDRRLLVGGPATAAGAWIERLATHAAETGKAFDFVTSYTYGNVPLDARPALARHGFPDVPVWWTDRGPALGSVADSVVADSVVADSVARAPFMLSGFAGAQEHVDALAYRMISDHTEESDRPARLFHGGPGLLTIGNLGKPSYWAVYLAAHLGDRILATDCGGDGAGVLVQAWATRHHSGIVDVLLWNGTVNATLAGDPRLDRHVRLTVAGLMPGVAYEVELARIDQVHSNISTWFPANVDWPDETMWSRIRSHDALTEDPLPVRPATTDDAAFDLRLPMPGVARIRLRPAVLPPRQSQPARQFQPLRQSQPLRQPQPARQVPPSRSSQPPNHR